MDPIMLALINQARQSTKHAVQRTTSVVFILLVVGGLAFGGYLIYKKFMQSTESYHQVAKRIDNTRIYIQQPEDSFFLGVKILGVKIGISKETKTKVEDTAIRLGSEK